jgi:hypothetical protein
LSYGTGGDLLDVLHGGGIAVSTAVAKENAGEVLTDIFTGFASLDSKPISTDELERTIAAYRAGLASIGETGGGLFEDIMAQLGAGTRFEESYARRVATTRLSLNSVRRQARRLASLESAVIVVVGDPTVRPQLEELGFAVDLVSRPPRSAIPREAPPSPPVPPSGLT